MSCQAHPLHSLVLALVFLWCLNMRLCRNLMSLTYAQLGTNVPWNHILSHEGIQWQINVSVYHPWKGWFWDTFPNALQQLLAVLRMGHTHKSGRASNATMYKCPFVPWVTPFVLHFCSYKHALVSDMATWGPSLRKKNISKEMTRFQFLQV